MNDGCLFLYGPPGAGKSAAGRQLAENLGIAFIDLDAEIEERQNLPIAEIFAAQGESGFRRIESEMLREITAGEGMRAVVALGGGALLADNNRDWVESRGRVLTLSAPLPVLIRRLRSDPAARPLLGGDLEGNLQRLLAKRTAHYASFQTGIDMGAMSIEEAAWEMQITLGVFRIRSMGTCEVRFRAGALADAGEYLAAEMASGKVALISDENVHPLHGQIVLQGLQAGGFEVFSIVLPAGEQYKTVETLAQVWDELLAHGMGRDGMILALGGGVISDLAGFAAATFLRGVRWAALPTTLLAMVDASLGGKTGIDLPRGKNLAGAFHPPVFVLSDPHALHTLPEREWRSGLAEVVKHAVIADPRLFASCEALAGQKTAGLDPQIIAEILRRAAAVKIRIIERDPYEQGEREALNFGHTLGHAVEAASGYRILHGEAVAIGMVLETRLSEQIGLAHPGLTATIAALLEKLGLPVQVPPNLDGQKLLQAVQVDKKRKDGKIRFSLPVAIGEVKTGVGIDDLWRRDVFGTGTAWTQPEPAG